MKLRAYTPAATRPAVIAVSLLVLAVGAAGCGASGRRQAFPIAVGIASSEPETAADGGRQFFATLRSVGMTTARLVLYRQNPALLAGLRRSLAHAAGIDVSLVLIDRPGTIRTGGDVAAFAAWADGIAREFPTIRRFVVWNEPNSRAFWHGGADRYAQLLSATYDALKAVNPDVRVSGLGLASGHRPVEFLRSVLRAGGRMDELSIHPYPPAATSTADAPFAFVRRVETVWHGPLNLDEFGWQVEASGRGYRGRENVATTTEQGQAQRYARFLRLAARDPRVRSALVYELHDDAELAGWQAGLARADGSERPSFRAVVQELRAPEP